MFKKDQALVAAFIAFHYLALLSIVFQWLILLGGWSLTSYLISKYRALGFINFHLHSNSISKHFFKLHSSFNQVPVIVCSSSSLVWSAIWTLTLFFHTLIYFLFLGNYFHDIIMFPRSKFNWVSKHNTVVDVYHFFIFYARNTLFMFFLLFTLGFEKEYYIIIIYLCFIKEEYAHCHTFTFLYS